jgi:tryptophan halogenase
VKKVTIVGGGTAGWFAAAWLAKYHPNLIITLIESPNIPKIGVGETVTPHVAQFFKQLGINDKVWMKETGAIYKFGNKFVDWNSKENKIEYSSFNYPRDITRLNTAESDVSELFLEKDKISTSDVLMHLLSNKKLDKFDKYFNTQCHYMDNNVMPYKTGEYTLSPLYSWSQHINAEKAASFIKDNHAIPNGVIHVLGEVKDVIAEGDNIKSLILTDDTTQSADFFIDATGFRRVLATKLGWKYKEYANYPIRKTWVCQRSYSDPTTELVNHTQSIAEPFGWRFKVCLYHRMGTGYSFSPSHVSDETVLDYFKERTDNRLMEPRLISWTPGRIETPAKGNVALIGLSIGFVEALEATSLLVITESIKTISDVLAGERSLSSYNDKITGLLDNIYDFIIVHYTLSNRDDTDFWKDMQELGRKDNHLEMIKDKFKKLKFGQSLGFPDFLWGQVAKAWGVDLSTWNRTDINADNVNRTYDYFISEFNKHQQISAGCENTYQWLKKNIYN